MISPLDVLSAVSPPTIPRQSDSMVTQTNGKLSKCHATLDISSSEPGLFASMFLVPAEILILAMS